MFLVLSQTNREKLLLERKNYYSNTFVKFELVKNLKNKELAFLDMDTHKKNVRYLYSSKIDFLDMHFKHLGFFDFNVNMYCSCANLSHIPILTYNLKLRRQTKEYQELDNNYAKYVISNDFFLDYDLKDNFESGLKEVKEMKVILEEMKIPFVLQNSSKQGFHFIVRGYWFDNSEPLKNLDIFKNIIYNLKGIYNFESLDNSVGDLKRIRKLSYSVVSDGSICLPLSDQLFESFTPEMVEINNVLKNIKIKNRGLLERNYGLSESELRQNVAKFIKEYQ
jgi:hypothetical protein